MRVNLLDPGSWAEVTEALVLSGITPRQTLRESMGCLRRKIRFMQSARVAKEHLDRVRAGLKHLERLDKKLSVKDRKQVVMYRRPSGKKDN